MNTQQLEMVLTAVDRASPVLRAVTGGLHNLARAAEAVLGAFKKLAAGGLELARDLVSGVVGALERVASIALRAAGVLGGALLAGMVAIGKAGVDMNVTVERATMALIRLTGSSQNASELIGALRQEAYRTQLTFKDLLPIAQSLTAAYGPGGIGKVIPTIRAFGDVATSLGVDEEAQKRALLGFRQLLSRDKPTQEDLNQVSENLPGLDVRGILRRKLGSSDTEALQDAGITGRQVAEALIAGMEETFGGSQSALGNTLPIILSNFADAWNNLTAAITARFTPALTAALGKVLQVVQGLAGNERLISALAVPFDLLAAAIGKAADALPGLVEWFSQIVTKENVIGLLSDVAGWIQTIAQRVMEFVNTATNGGGLLSIWEAFQAAAKTAIDLALRGISGLAAGLQYLGQHSDEIWALIQAGINGAADAMDTLIGGATILMGILAADKIAGIVAALGPLIAIAASLGLIPGTGGSSGSGSPSHVNAGMSGGIDGILNNIIKAALGNIPGVRNLRNQMSGTPNGTTAAPSAPGSIPPWIAEPAQSAIDWAFKQGGLRNLGRTVRGATGDFLNTNIPQGLKDFGGGLYGAIQGGFQSGGLDDLLNRQAQNAASARGAINRFLGPSTGVPSDPNAPATMLYRQGGAAGNAEGVPALPDKKELKAIEAAREAYFRMLSAQAKAAGALLGSDEESAAERAWLDLEAQTPALEAKQANLLARMQELAAKANKTAEDTKEYLDAQTEWYSAEEAKADLRTRAQDAERRAGERAQREQETASKKQRSVAAKQIDLAVAAVENNPLLSNKGRGEAMANVLAQKFAFLSQAQPGETEEEALDRQIQAQSVRGDIFKSLGLGMKSVGLLGGGTLDIGNRGRIGEVSSYLDNLAQRAGMSAPAQAPVSAPPVNINAPINADLSPEAAAKALQDPGFAAAFQQFFQNYLYQQSQQANPGVSY